MLSAWAMRPQERLRVEHVRLESSKIEPETQGATVELQDQSWNGTLSITWVPTPERWSLPVNEVVTRSRDII